MIPKVIHYCWFGEKPLTKLAKKCIKSWRKYCPDYEIIEWNDSNYKIYDAPLYVQQAFNAKKWAFVTDYVRLQIIFENGGIYFDTDVELIRSFDELLHYDAFFGLELSHYINTGLGFGAKKGTFILKKLMDSYRGITFVSGDGSFDLTPCPKRNSTVFLEEGFSLEDKNQIIDNIAVFSSEYFCPKNYISRELIITSNTYSIHHFDGSWYPSEMIKAKKKRDLRNRVINLFNQIKKISSKIYHFIKKK